MEIKKNNFGLILLICGLLTQVITYIITKDSFLSFISGVTGMISVIQCSERKYSFYFWSFIQIITFSVICFNEQLYAKLLENMFYLITMGVGIGTWLANKDIDNRVKTRALKVHDIVKCCILGMIVFVFLFIPLQLFGDTAPLLDAITTTLAFIAQILMILRYKENWVVWCVMNIICVVLFAITYNWCMVVQYVFWTINTVYGYTLWRKNA